MDSIKKCFNIILEGEKEESRLAARTLRKILHSAGNRDEKFQSIGKIMNEAPFEYAKIVEAWRQENFVIAISVIDFLSNEEKDFDSLFPWRFQLLQHPNGNIRFATVKMFERDIRYLTYHIRFPEYEHGKEKSERADNILNTLFLSLDRLLPKLWKPGYGRYKYIDFMPASPYKSTQMVMSKLRECLSPDESMDSQRLKDDYYFDAMDCLCEGEDVEAVRLLNKTLEMDNHYLPGFVGLISAYLGIRDMDKYREYVNTGFDEVKRIYTEWPDKILWGDIEERSILRIICYKAQLEHVLGNLEEAEILYRLLLRLNPNDNQGVRYLIAAMFAGFSPDYINELMEEGNRKQDWDKLEEIFEEQNRKHDFYSYDEDLE
ncbi:MAG: hypothetical protein PHW52_04790 [Candidatus Pacebacteria bacterium]|nr:hypothetical protein [Candidatus Paceibacterota bacterium]